MKIILEAILVALTLHAIYFIGILLFGWFLTQQYTPNIETSWNHVEGMNNQVVFGTMASPPFPLV
ncbi:hypothetical protein HNO89_003601 [Sporosarcina luteola]|nr:hypothetical protein [Sporosarcina luteola]